MSNGNADPRGYHPSGSIVLVPHDPRWALAFEQEREALAAAFAAGLVEIHHIGSTSIPGIVAKPVIDMLILAESLEALDEATPALVALGYEAKGEFGIPRRRYFRKNSEDGVRTHQIHGFEASSPEVQRHLVFRDYLRQNPDVADRYSDLKQQLANRFDADVERYADAKGPFIREVLQGAATPNVPLDFPGIPFSAERSESMSPTKPVKKSSKTSATKAAKAPAANKATKAPKAKKVTSAPAATKRSDGFTAEERAAMKERARELKSQSRSDGKKADGESDVMAKIREMRGLDRALAEKVHALVKATAPSLSPKTWYGMPAYARDGKIVCFFKNAQKFNARYATFEFTDQANLDDGDMWAVGFALKQIGAAEEARIVALVKKAVS
jgi:GrpB-like predicted nucleotidyltransferase (UPF0157 family)/uncharacterized protein YdhG (YjbR/CyaY superfamily)